MKTIRNYFIYFMAYAFLGWIYEVLLGIFQFHLGFINRGFLFGPYLPLYGVGAIIFICLLDNLKNKRITVLKLNIMPVLIFLAIMFIATTLELVTSYLMEFFIGKWLWDYNGYFMNYEGRIALETSIRFGIGGMAILYVIQPFLNRILTSGKDKQINIIFVTMGLIFVLDVISRAFLGSNI